MRTLALLAMTMVVGCTYGAGVDGGGGAMEEQDYANGARLQARLLKSGDGAWQFWGWHDTQLGVDCAFETTNEGLRCVPTAVVGENGEYFFTDPDCTEEVIGVWETECPTGEPVYQRYSGACGPFFTKIDRITRPIRSYSHTNNACVVDSASPPQWLTYYRLGEDVDSTVFQSAMIAIDH